MAINNTNTISTKLGVDVSSTYIRLEIYLGTGKEIEIGYHVYPNKLSFTNNERMINNILEFDFERYRVENLLSNEITIDNLHDLAITELVARGMDNTKLVKADLV
jgi:hypothetical protein